MTIRAISSTDSIAELTELLHRAYRQLAEMGLRFFATHQTEEQTRERVSRGRCFVGLLDDRIVGTITLYSGSSEKAPEIYRRDGLGYFGQFAVDPLCQGRGLGAMLLAHVEATAREEGLLELALDTAAPATHLIDYYSRHGYRIVDHVQWDDTNYPSVIMTKSLVERSVINGSEHDERQRSEA